MCAGVFASAASAGGYTDESYLTPVGKVGASYAHQVQWKPGNGCPPYSYAVVGGDFPPGLSLNGSSGWITGTPTRAGTYTFYIRQTDLCGPEGEGNAPFVITIQPAAAPPAPPAPPQPPLALTTGSLAPATAGSAYAATLTASGGSSYSYAVSAGSLPPGVTLSADGRLGGTPTSPGSYAFTVRVTDQAGRTASAQLTLEVRAALALGEPGAVTAEARRHVSVQLQASGGAAPYRWSSTPLPDGLFLDAEKGLIVGAPRHDGTYGITVTLTDAAGATRTSVLSLTVAPKLRFTSRTGTLAAARAGHAYRARIGTAGGVGRVSFAIVGGALPKGLKLDARTGVVSGRTKAHGRFTFGVAATDSFGRTSTHFALLVTR